MNQHFCSLEEKLAKNIPVTGTPPEQYVNKRVSTQFVFTPVTEEQVYHVISKLSTSKSCGLDKISSRLLKRASPYISDVICIIINQSFDTGIFPDDWKLAKVFPVYKARGVATCTHGRTCIPEKMLKKGNSGFICSTFAWKKTYKKLFQRLLGRTIEHYLFAYKQLSNLLSLHSCTVLLSLSSVIVRVSVAPKRTVGDSDWRLDNLSGGHLQSQSIK